MPLVTYGPLKGQWISWSETDAYMKANGMAAGVDEATGESRAFMPDPRDDSPEEVEKAYQRANQERISAYGPEGALSREQYNSEREGNKAWAADSAAQSVARAADPTLQDAYSRAAQGNQTNAWDRYFANAGRGSSVSMPGFDTGFQNQDRLNQTRVIQDLQTQASGKLTQPLRDQLQQGYNQAKSQQSSLGSTMRGQSAGAAQRGVSSGQQEIQRGFAGDEKMLQLQQQQAAQAMLAQLLSQQNGQDVNQASLMAQGQLQGDALDEAMRQFYTQGSIEGQLGNYQYGSDLGRARLGFDLEAEDAQRRARANTMAAGATVMGQAVNMGRGNNNTNSGYRQVDGVNSIVSEDDK